MKTIYTFILFNLLFITCKSQQVYDLCSFDKTIRDGRYYKDLQGNLNQFIGVWKNTTGNKTFKVTFWKEEKEDYNDYYIDRIHGDYEMIENEGQPNEIVLYKSKKLVGNTGQYFTPSIIVRGFCDGGIGGVIMDNTSMTNTNIRYVNGDLSFFYNFTLYSSLEYSYFRRNKNTRSTNLSTSNGFDNDKTIIG